MQLEFAGSRVTRGQLGSRETLAPKETRECSVILGLPGSRANEDTTDTRGPRVSRPNKESEVKWAGQIPRRHLLHPLCTYPLRPHRTPSRLSTRLCYSIPYTPLIIPYTPLTSPLTSPRTPFSPSNNPQLHPLLLPILHPHTNPTLNSSH